MSNSRQFKTWAELGQAHTSFWVAGYCIGCLLGSTKLTKLVAAENNFLCGWVGGEWGWFDQMGIDKTEPCSSCGKG